MRILYRRRSVSPYLKCESSKLAGIFFYILTTLVDADLRSRTDCLNVLLRSGNQFSVNSTVLPDRLGAVFFQDLSESLF